MSVGREIGRASALLLSGTAAVQVLGFARSLIIARQYGTGPALDAYYAALTLPSLLAAMITIAAEASLLPLYLERRELEGAPAAELVYGRCCAVVLLALAALAALLAAGADRWAAWLAPGFEPEQRSLTAHLLRIAAPVLMLSGACDLLSTLFLAHRRFALPVSAPVLGAAVSLAVLGWGAQRGPEALPGSLIAGGAAQAGLLILALPRAGLHLRLRAPRPATRGIPAGAALSPACSRPSSAGAPARAAGPSAGASLLTLLGSAALGNGQTAVDRMFASACPSGSVSVLSYGLNLSTVPSQLFIKTVDSAVFPFLSQQAAEGRLEDLRATFRRAVRLTFVLVAPATAAILALAPAAVRLVFERGSFGPESTVAVAAAWRLYGLGLVFKTLVSLSARVLSACRETRALLLSAAIGLASTVVLDAALLPVLSYRGIALASSATAAAVAATQLALARARLGPLGLRSLLAPLASALACGGLATVVMLAVRRAVPAPPLWSLLAAGGAGVAVYLGGMLLLSREDLRSLARLGRAILPGGEEG